jgi:hypothetical protein
MLTTASLKRGAVQLDNSGHVTWNAQDFDFITVARGPVVT